MFIWRLVYITYFQILSSFVLPRIFEFLLLPYSVFCFFLLVCNFFSFHIRIIVHPCTILLPCSVLWFFLYITSILVYVSFHIVHLSYYFVFPILFYAVNVVRYIYLLLLMLFLLLRAVCPFYFIYSYGLFFILFPS